MSRYRGNDTKCPHCGITYGEFRTGITFREARANLWSPDEDPSHWRYRRRRTVLGYMFALKQMWWKMHVESACPQIGLGATGTDGVPF